MWADATEKAGTGWDTIIAVKYFQSACLTPAVIRSIANRVVYLECIEERGDTVKG